MTEKKNGVSPFSTKAINHESHNFSADTDLRSSRTAVENHSPVTWSRLVRTTYARSTSRRSRFMNSRLYCIAGLIPQCLQLQVQVTLVSLGWSDKSEDCEQISGFLWSERRRCQYWSAYVAAAIVWLRQGAKFVRLPLKDVVQNCDVFKAITQEYFTLTTKWKEVRPITGHEGPERE